MSRTTQIFCASTLYGAATLAAALDAGCFAPAGRRLLVVLNNGATPETSTPVDRMNGFEALRGRFDDVVSFNEAIRPLHPGSWTPRGDELPLWERYFRLTWQLGDAPVELVVESLQVNPALAICRVFHGAPVHAYADGLMSYGPTRSKIDPMIGTRVQRLLHLDLVPSGSTSRPWTSSAHRKRSSCRYGYCAAPSPRGTAASCSSRTPRRPSASRGRWRPRPNASARS